jgi:hypothetical protein
MNWLQRILSHSEPTGNASGGAIAATIPQPVVVPPPPVNSAVNVRDQADTYLHNVQEKMNKLANEFAQGLVNRAQFVQLYEHYQREKQTIERILEISPETWRDAATEGRSISIRREHSAQALGFSIYENASGMPLTTLGKFDLDPALMVPMLSSYREATREIFGSRMRSTQIENGRWLCFVAGQFTTLIALYNTEPAARQLQILEETHLFFESANRPRLQQSPINTEGLVFPHEYYLR